MAYRLYGGSPADYVIDSSGRPVAGATLTVWTAATGGTQVVDLLDAAGSPATVVTSDAYGGFRFQAPDTQPSVLWVDGGVSGAPRYAVHATEAGTRLDTVEDGLATEITDRGASVAQVITDAQGFTNAAVANHEAEPASSNPHPIYVRARDTATGGFIQPTIWIGNTQPSGAQGAVDGDVLFYTA